MSTERFGAALLEAIATEQVQLGDGRLAVLVPASRAEELTALVRSAQPTVAEGSDPALLDAPTAIIEVGQSKGLEFDAVLIADPASILADSPRGASDLYVAVTRATRRLGVIADGPLPEMLHGLVPAGDRESGRGPVAADRSAEDVPA